MKTYPQGSLVWPKEHLKLGRMSATPGQSFWVANSMLNQKNDNRVMIARSGRNSGSAIPVSFTDMEKYFTTNP